MGPVLPGERLMRLEFHHRWMDPPGLRKNLRQRERVMLGAATGAAEPDDDPPGVGGGLRGLSVAGGSRGANAVVVVLPRMAAPACFSIATTDASARGRHPR